MNNYCKCPLNYAGGKFRVLHELEKNFPKNIPTLYDLFGGAGNVTANIKANKYVFNEINTYLYEIIKGLKDKDSQYTIDKIHMILDEYNPIEKEGFLNLRTLYNSENLQDKWIYLIVLASFSFNYMARFNNKHQYNGSYAKGICKYNTSIENNIINFSKLLKERNIDFYNKDFREVDLSSLTSSDLVYLDPPYYLSCGVYQDGKRGFSGWTKEEELNMYKLCDNINSKGCKFALSNLIESKGNIHTELYEWIDKNGYNLIYINKDKGLYNTNYHKKVRYKDIEVLITNY